MLPGIIEPYVVLNEWAEVFFYLSSRCGSSDPKADSGV